METSFMQHFVFVDFQKIAKTVATTSHI